MPPHAISRTLLALGVMVAMTLMTDRVSASSAAVPAPAWSIQALAAPTNFKPGEESGLDRYEVFLTNSGGEVTDHSPITITDTLPQGLVVKSVELQPPRGGALNLAPAACETQVAGSISTVTCKVTDALLPANRPGEALPRRSSCTCD